MKIKLQLKDIIKSDRLINLSGFNPYCVNEGADGNDWIEFECSVDSIDELAYLIKGRVMEW